MTHTAHVPRFTERQRQVVRLIAEGCSNDEIATQLGITPRTAKAHCDALRAKLGVPRRRHIPQAYRARTGHDPLEHLRPGESHPGPPCLR